MTDRSSEPGPLSVAEPWTLVAEGYQETTRTYLEAFSAAALKLVGFDESTEVVDVACGPGTTALLLAPEVRRIACVDFSEGMLARLRLNIAAAGLSNIEVHQADGQALPFPDESFDLAVSMFGLMFFPDRDKGLFRTVPCAAAGRSGAGLELGAGQPVAADADGDGRLSVR